MTQTDKETLLYNYAEAQGLLSSKQDIETFNKYIEENNINYDGELFDYVILDEYNRLISNGYQETQEHIDKKVEELVNNTYLSNYKTNLININYE